MNQITSFEMFLQEGGRRLRTIEEYRHAILSLERWYQDTAGIEFDPDVVTTRDLHEWVTSMQIVKRLVPAMINKRIAAMKVYWFYLAENQYSILNPTGWSPDLRGDCLGDLLDNRF